MNEENKAGLIISLNGPMKTLQGIRQTRKVETDVDTDTVMKRLQSDIGVWMGVRPFVFVSRFLQVCLPGYLSILPMKRRYVRDEIGTM